MLVCNKSGALMPVLSSIKDAPIDEGQSFLWALRELRTDTEFLLLDGASGTILAVSAGAGLLLQLEVGKPGTYPPVNELLLEYGSARVQEELVKGGAGGVVLSVRPVEEEEEEGGGGG